ncbi:MAG: hypothetical protein ACI9BK_001737 [Acidimicrobiales bacterium]|jgi:hypothetical protein
MPRAFSVAVARSLEVMPHTMAQPVAGNDDLAVDCWHRSNERCQLGTGSDQHGLGVIGCLELAFKIGGGVGVSEAAVTFDVDGR